MNFFGFSRSEAHGVMILLLMVFSVMLVGHFLPRIWRYEHPIYSEITMEEWDKQVKGAIRVREAKVEPKSKPIPREKFYFDPNLASRADFVALGFKEVVASRVVNYRMAGGSFTKTGDLKKIYGINTDLIDELDDWIRIPEVEVPPPQPEDEVEMVSFELNTASKSQLLEIRGIGEVLSSRIVGFREKLGGFHDFHQLNEVYKLSEDAIVELKRHTTIDPTAVKTILLNEASSRQLSGHPYIDYNVARAIINYREVHGPFQSLSSLTKIKILNDSILTRVSPYLSID